MGLSRLVLKVARSQVGIVWIKPPTFAFTYCHSECAEARRASVSPLVYMCLAAAARGGAW